MKTNFLKFCLTILLIVTVIISFGQRGERARDSRESRTRTEVKGNDNFQRREQRVVQQRSQRVEQRGNIQERQRPIVRDNRGIREQNYSRYYKIDHLPYYFKSNSYYWHHPTYGHVIKRFHYNPIVIYSNRFPYYIDNGFLYRYYNGIGYVWIEDPYDMWFDEIPYGATRVIVNGYLYFKVGHAFFQYRQHLGYRLVILPEHYYNY